MQLAAQPLLGAIDVERNAVAAEVGLSHLNLLRPRPEACTVILNESPRAGRFSRPAAAK
jgi:hypothetical protein